jgi:hypothetical protein
MEEPTDTENLADDLVVQFAERHALDLEAPGLSGAVQLMRDRAAVALVTLRALGNYGPARLDPQLVLPLFRRLLTAHLEGRQGLRCVQPQLAPVPQRTPLPPPWTDLHLGLRGQPSHCELENRFLRLWGLACRGGRRIPRGEPTPEPITPRRSLP